MNTITKELERIITEYTPIVAEGNRVSIGLLDGILFLQKGNEEEGEAPMVIRVDAMAERLSLTVEELFEG
ncbi:hypothetical protein BEH_24925 (plasmid) [Priestia filamentosa]|uniref:Uncharacterized protein n=1 Tax=Priestia filamentosa TaxID=1402861 RepID=A0A2S1M0R1_9BACI|nr:MULTISPECIES: hypothetical protein [Priestia]AVD54598.1 hypothetical protein CKF96_03640 [Priestia filamentosa]AWG44945.1 hypothetical protein BEH_24925 [Priestia filamentosa]MBG9813270.1 hypothetical protein [Priestia endophytica]RAS71636.1 hypothetical protein A4U60_26085 [Priestia endophytica]RAS75555.1 hypothetical protein A4R27_22210 [Priestia endophytica]